MRIPSLLAAVTLVAPGLAAQADAAAGADRPLVRWQRTLEDALALAKNKKLPLLVVANQDGEIFCDSLADNRYRSARFAGLANRYVAVIASVDRFRFGKRFCFAVFTRRLGRVLRRHRLRRAD